MKLRLRCRESMETLKMEVPDSCTLQQFKQLLSQQVSSSSSSSSSFISVSLNRREELSGSPDESLQALGVISGDLIFYSLVNNNNNHPNPVPPQTLVSDSPNSQTFSKPDLGSTQFGQFVHGDSSVQHQVSESGGEMINLGESKTLIQSETVHQQDLSESDGSYCSDSDMNEADMGQSETLDSTTQREETTVVGMEIGDGSGSATVVEKSFSVPSFLRKVLRNELTDDGSDHRLLVISLHAVLLDSGFVPFDPMTNRMVDRFHLPDEWPSNSLTMTLWYTLPVLFEIGSEIVETVVLKLCSLGTYIIVHGSLGRNGSDLHSVRLDEYRFGQTLDLVWASKCGSTSSNSYPEGEVFEFWKIVKDGLALPLLIDLCDRAGLNLPPCLMRLPAEIKLKILELLPGEDLAKVGCVCSELRYLSSGNDLWKQKVGEEFGQLMSRHPSIAWKTKFASWWESRKEKKRHRATMRTAPRIGRPYNFLGRRDPEPYGMPRIIGGEHDLWPVFGAAPYRRPTTRSMPRQGARLTFSPNCNLGRLSP